MGYGPVVNGKQKPITPWKGSWAETVNNTKCPTCQHGKGSRCHQCWPMPHGTAIILPRTSNEI